MIQSLVIFFYQSVNRDTERKDYMKILCVGLIVTSLDLEEDLKVLTQL